MDEPIVIVDRLGKCYPIGGVAIAAGSRLNRLARLLHSSDEKNNAVHWALKEVSFTVKRGERIGIIGRNGAGKSTLLKIMSRVSYPTTGEVRIRGTLTSLLEVGTGFNDNLSGRENIYLNASLYGMSRSEVDRKFNEIVAFSEVGRFIDTPVKHYSSGMRMRLAFSVAAHLEPDILLLDEVLAVGDMSFQRKCLERVDDLTSGGRTLFFVSHGMDSIIRYCNRCIWLDGGSIRMDGDVQDVISSYVEAVLDVRSTVTLSSSDSTVLSDDVVKHDPSVKEHQASSDSLLGVTGNARLVSAQIVDSTREKKTLFTVSQSVGVEMVYEVTEPGVYFPGIHLYCPQGTLLFAAIPPETDLNLFKKEGACQIRAIAWLPKDIFNVGTYSVSLVVFSPLEAPFKRYFMHDQMLSFHCVDAAIGERSARGLMPRGFPGPIRPLIEWSLENEV